jgi:CBS domain-containing protein
MATIRHILQLKGQDIWTIAPGATVFEALRLMADKDIGAVLVVENDHLIGILSERDYARKIILHNKASKDTLVSEIMTTHVYLAHPTQTARECMELMAEKHIRHLPVVEDGCILGVVSITDLVRDIIFQQRETIKNLEEKVAGT